MKMGGFRGNVHLKQICKEFFISVILEFHLRFYFYEFFVTILAASEHFALNVSVDTT